MNKYGINSNHPALLYEAAGWLYETGIAYLCVALRIIAHPVLYFVYILIWKTMLSVLENDVFYVGKRCFLCWKTMFSVLENDIFYGGQSVTNH